MIAATGQVKTRVVHITDQSAPRGTLEAGFAAALDWWREAGVDHDYQDNPRDWLPAAVESEGPVRVPAQDSAEPALSAKPAPAIIVGGDPASWPQRLEDFSAWWLAEPSLDHGIVMERIAPRGPHCATLMVLVDHPEAIDRTALLSGPEGKLLNAFLLAAGIATDSVYLASVLPRHTPLPDWTALIATGLDKVTAHHVALAAPQRVILLGSHISPLLGHDPANSAETLSGFNHDGRTIPTLVAPGLTEMLARPRRKAVLWQRWLDWTGQGS